MILVVCPNLALDVTLDVDALELGGVHRTRRVRRQAGGKGVNLARAARALGERPVIVGLIGGSRGREVRELLREEGLESDLVDVAGDTRTCTIVLEPSGTATVINEVGPRVGDGTALVDSFRRLVDGAGAIALMGSLQPGLPRELYRELVTLARGAEKFCLVDTSGPALGEAISAGPDVVKPNVAEAERLLNRSLETERSCADAAHELCRAGAGLALVTRGADGVVFASRGTAARSATVPPVDIRYGNPTGAGDALAAGLLAGRLRGFAEEDMVRLGVAAATASLAEGYGRFRAKDVRSDAVCIRRLD